MLTAEKFHAIVFERDKVDISLPVFAATSYLISPSEPSLERFMKAMIDNVKKFESANGIIQDMEAVEIPFNFSGPVGQA